VTSFDKFLQKYIFRIIGASLGGGLHLFVLATGVFGGGEGPTFVLMYMDFPIVYLWSIFIGSARVDDGSLLFLWFIGGTLMYALFGWLIGWMGDWLRQLSQEG
jgi:hypothetical protein